MPEQSTLNAEPLNGFSAGPSVEPSLQLRMPHTYRQRDNLDGAMIRHIRTSMGLKQDQMARLLGRCIAHVGKLEKDRAKLTSWEAALMRRCMIFVDHSSDASIIADIMRDHDEMDALYAILSGAKFAIEKAQ